MYKKLFTMVLPACLAAVFALAGCTEKTITTDESRVQSIESKLKISANEADAELLSYEDTHGGFLGDGSTYAVIGYSDSLAELLENSPYWLPMPVPTNLQDVLFGYIDEDGALHGGHMSSSFVPPEEGYWFFRNDNQGVGASVYLYDLASPDDYSYGKGDYSHNFTVAWYDTTENLLYYYRSDT